MISVQQPCNACSVNVALYNVGTPHLPFTHPFKRPVQVREKLNRCLMRYSPQLGGVPINVVSASLEQSSGAIVGDAPGVQCSVFAKYECPRMLVKDSDLLASVHACLLEGEIDVSCGHICMVKAVLATSSC